MAHLPPAGTDSLPDAPIDRLLNPLRDFASNKVAGAILLLAAAAAAIAWVNSAWADSYTHLLHLPIAIQIGSFELAKSLQHWINDGLMGLFFFLVGLEIKRELLAGELASLRKAALPVVGAIGGMAAPAAIYALVNGGGPGAAGWGVPMATDIAFALGVLATLGSRVPLGAKVFLTALSIADDLGAIVVIAVFYSDDVSLSSLGIAALVFAISLAANRLGVRNTLVYFAFGTIVWLMFLRSGVHATLAAVLMAFTIPARSRVDCRTFVDRIASRLRDLRSGPGWERRRLLPRDEQHALDDIVGAADDASAPLQRLEHALAPWVTFLVLPVFALANAGVVLDRMFLEALTHPVGVGAAAGLLIGKPLGILAFAWLAVRTRLADLPAGVAWRHMLGVGMLGGIGFTMSLFIGSLAFADAQFREMAKAGVLAASLLAGTLGWLLLRSMQRAPAPSV